ncbi:hypothetical protein QFC21_005570 [Naganishia friedmannii]|uniref:Uncharacterized protein n=1 Tax=Naganishia friedmannii TaxID=89922 RepID=A0ACC2V9A9_9TREE|nr:hypothetical protein QFC21_005570 [Naganishia friedmannii]
MARRRQAFNSDLISYAEPTTNQNPANRSAPNATSNAQRQPPPQQQQQQHRQHHHQPPIRAPGPVHAKVAHEVDDSQTLEVPGEPVAQVIAPATSDDDSDGSDDSGEEEDGDSDERSGMAPPLPAVSDEETCFICAEKITYFAVGGQVQRGVGGGAETLLPSLLFTTDAETPFPSTPPDSKLPPGTLDMSAFEFSDAKLGIVFENAEMVLYPPHLIGLHDPSRLSRGQRPKPRNKMEEQMVASWGAPHPMCEFCHEAFFGADELFKHMRTKHEECFVCKEQGQRDVYFRDYLKLEAHFNHAHHPCTEQICLEKKFVVFGSEVDLKAHMVNEHGAKMNSKDRHRARQIEVGFVHFGPDDSFIPPEPSAAQRRNNQTARPEPSDQFSRVPRGGRHTAPQSQQLPQPPNDREARRAFERTLTINDDNSGNGSRNSKNRSQAPADVTEAAVAARHAQVMDLVMSMVDYSEPKMASFRNSVRAFKNNEAGARDMIYTIYSVLNSDQESTVKIARDIVGLFNGDTEKQKSILEAVNEFKIDRRNEFPTLGDGPTGVGTEFAGIASGKILSAKRVTQPGSNSNAIWDRVERAAASAPVNRPVSTGPGGRKVPGASGSFPALGPGSKSASKASGSSATPWAGRTAPPTRSGFPILQPSAVPVAPQPRSVNFSTTSANGQKKAPKPPSAAAFPGLPSSSTGSRGLTSADRQALFGGSDRAQMVSRMKGVDNTTPAGWAAGSNSGSTTPPADAPTSDAAQGGGKKKNKKQTLFTFSATGR